MSSIKTFSVIIRLYSFLVITQGQMSMPSFKDMATCMSFAQKCSDDLRQCPCNDKWFDPPMRPICCQPQDAKIQVQFYQKSNPEKHCLVEPNKESMDQCQLCDASCLKILIHGFGTDMTGDDKKLYEDFKKAILEHTDCSVIFLKWSPFNGVEYPQAVANARAVGKKLGEFLEALQKHNCVQANNIHLIGHSLGCHIASFAAKELKIRLPEILVGRITGCDCAGPFFQSRKGMADCGGRWMKRAMSRSPWNITENEMKKVRLWHGDANCTDCVHTNDGCTPLEGFGCKEPLGHMDMYPNGGSAQPGCDKEGVRMDVSVTKMDGSRKVDQLGSKGCNHFRCLEYITKSISNKEAFPCILCESYEKFLKGECDSNPKAYMGMCAKSDSENSVGRKWYCTTTAESLNSR